MFNPGKIETVSGKIVKVKYYDELRLIIYTDAKKPVLVALGPIDYFVGQNKMLKVGDTVTVTEAVSARKVYLSKTYTLSGSNTVEVARRVREEVKQLNAEMWSGYIYLSMSAWFEPPSPLGKPGQLSKQGKLSPKSLFTDPPVEGQVA